MSAIPLSRLYNDTRLAIHAWAEADRPREKLILKGRHHLSNAELIAILIGSGSKQESALELAQRILRSVDNNLNLLGKKNRRDFCQFNGIGDAKAVSLIAALELGRRRQLVPAVSKPQVRSSEDAYLQLAPIISELEHEECWILCLNRANHIIHSLQISSGGRAGTIVDAKIVFGRALEFKASSIILAHNHPSGSLLPSQADKNLTQKLFAAGKHLDLPLLDHLIISENGYYSFADEGEMS